MNQEMQGQHSPQMEQRHTEQLQKIQQKLQEMKGQMQ